MRPLTRLCCVLLVVLLPILSTSLTPTSSARNYAVTTDGDTHDTNPFDSICDDGTGACTLRAAIEQANGDPGPDVIGMFPNVGVINLNSPLPEIKTNMTIMRQAPGMTVVRRNSPEPFRIFSVAQGVTATISNITVSGGLAPLPENGGPSLGGGGIYNAGFLTLNFVRVVANATADNTASVTPVAPAGGGGIQNDGVLTMNGGLVSQNVTGSAAAGTGLDGGAGGGIYNTGTLTMTGCTIDLNKTGNGGNGTASGGSAGSGGAGGGIYNAPSGARQVSAALTDCIVSVNSTGNGGAVAPGPQAEMSRSGNGGNGGGIYNASTMTVVGSTFGSTFVSASTGNTTGVGANAPQGKRTQAGKGGSGGGIYNNIPAGGGELKLTNCVFSNNSTGRGGVGSGEVISAGDGGDGGGIANPSANSVLKMSQCTVAFNRTGLTGDDGGRDGVGGGVYGAARIRSNIVARNIVHFPTNLSDVAGGPFTSLGYNFLGSFGGTCCFASTDRGGSNSNPMLDPTSLIPLPGSFVIDAGLALDTDGQPVTTDRRGAVRPFDFPSVAPQAGGDDSDSGAFERQATDPTPTPTPTPVHVAEGCAQADITVTRLAPTDVTSIATYVVTDSVDTSAHQRGDFTYTRGQVTFAPGEVTKTIPVLLSEDAYAEGPENFLVFVFDEQGFSQYSPNPGILTIDDNDATDGATNPIDFNAIFVCQHYHDFLGRHADPGGQAFWTARLEECNGDPVCLDRKRVDVSAAFFLSIESQNTGYYVIRVNKVGLGDQPGVPSYFDYLNQTQAVARGVIVGQPGYEALLEENKQRYASTFVQRPDFQSAHNSQNAAQFVNSLFANAGVTPTTQERDAALSAFGGGGIEQQAAALRSVVESGSVYNKLYNPAFVLSQYFGYLRRNPNDPPDGNFIGYNFWLNNLNSVTLPGEDVRDERVALARVRRAEMIRAFIRSDEYRGRFGGNASRGNP